MVNHIVTLLFTTTGLIRFDIEKNSLAGISTEVYILYLIYRLFNILQSE